MARNIHIRQHAFLLFLVLTSTMHCGYAFVVVDSSNTAVRHGKKAHPSKDTCMFSVPVQHANVVHGSDDEYSSSSGSRRRIAPSAAALWHKNRRREMIRKYPQISKLERASSQQAALPLLLLANFSLAAMAVFSGSLSTLQVGLLALFPGSIFSLWQLQILHDCLHGSLFPEDFKLTPFRSKKQIEKTLLFWASMPCAFGYYLYLNYGHLTHHRNVGNSEATLAKLFDSEQKDFEDGDVLFVAHRMKLKGDVGPKINGYEVSISRTGFRSWLGLDRFGTRFRAAMNATLFASSFLFERAMLIFNDFVVAVIGKNLFFPNKPAAFHEECATYCRCAVLVRITLVVLAGSWKALLFLYLAETLWSIPPHPAAAMFVTNHGSKSDVAGGCVPSSSTYAGRWYSLLTLGTNFHCEHHDFPTIPLHKLGKLREIAPEYYKVGSADNLLNVMEGAFADPDFYACLDSNIVNADV